MAKYIIVLIIETIVNVYWIYCSFIANDYFLFFSIIFFPLSFLVITISDIYHNRSDRYYVFSLLSIILLLIISFTYDGLTTYKSNPDSSKYGWILVVSFFKFISTITGYIILKIIKRILRNRL